MLPRAGKSKRMVGLLREHEGAGAFLLDALDAGRRAEMQRHVRSAQNVARHVAERAAAEIVEAAPVERLIEVAAELVRVAFAARRVRARFGDCRARGPNRASQGPASGGGNLGQALRPDRTIASRRGLR